MTMMISRTVDVAVVGAGPAGVAAALAARAAGLGVTLVDEAPAAGGQIHRAPFDAASAPKQDREGDALRAALALSGTQHLVEHRVWTVSTSPKRLMLSGPDGVGSLSAQAIVVAGGAIERILPFPGWTLPGVIGLAAATVLLKTSARLPAGPVVVAGRGPLLFAVAVGLSRRGVEVSAIVDASAVGDWAGALALLAARPVQLGQALRWRAELLARRIPVFHGHAPRRASGEACVEEVTIGPVDRFGAPLPGQETCLPVRLLCAGHGLVPATEILSQFGVPLEYGNDGVWTPTVDDQGRTPVPGLYAAGDGVRIRGAAAARLRGAIAGWTAALDLGAASLAVHARRTRSLRRRLSVDDRFGAAMNRLMTPSPASVAAIPPETVICRCEDVSRAAIDAAFTAGAASLSQLKTRTRCGMGPCQGRICGPTAAALASLHPHVGQPITPWTARPPLRPVAISDLVGSFSHDDIMVVKPAI